MRKTYCKSGLLVALACLFLAAVAFVATSGNAHASERFYSRAFAHQSHFSVKLLSRAARHRHYHHYYFGHGFRAFDDCNCSSDQGNYNTCDFCAPSNSTSSCDTCSTPSPAPSTQPSCDTCSTPSTAPNTTPSCSSASCTTSQQEVTGKVTTIDVETTTTTTTTVSHHSTGGSASSNSTCSNNGCASSSDTCGCQIITLPSYNRNVHR